MELYQLRYFLAVAESGNFTKAAQRCFISQPSLSQQILNLEEEFGQPLFHRLGRKAVLTEAGKTLVDGAQRILSEADHTLAALKNDPLLGPEVNVGAIQTVAPFFIPAVLAYCSANNVRLRLHTHEDFRRSLIEEVYSGKLDWALVSMPLSEPRLQIEKLYSEPLWLAVGAAHPLAKAERINFAALRNETFILLGEASTLASQIQRYCGEHDFEPRIGHRCGQLATVKAFAAMGLGISVLPQSARSATDPQGLVFRKFTEGAPSRDIAMIRHPGRHLGQGAGLFAEIARSVVGPNPTPRSSPSTPPVSV